MILDILYPKYCYLCNKKGDYICDICKKSFKKNLPECYICRRISPDFRTHAKCKKYKSFERIFIAWEYNNLSSVILKKYKYKGVSNISEKLSSMLTDVIYINNFQKYLSDSIVLPVPSSKQRYNERGFNQVDLIAKSVSKNFNLAYDNTILYRKLQFGHQALRDRKERLSSIDNSFYIKDYSKLKSFKIITLIDDVITTGKTLENIRNLFSRECSFQAVCLFRGKPSYLSFGSSFLTMSKSSVDICL